VFFYSFVIDIPGRLFIFNCLVTLNAFINYISKSESWHNKEVNGCHIKG
jgi:hypothetical protein